MFDLHPMAMPLGDLHEVGQVIDFFGVAFLCACFASGLFVAWTVLRGR